MVFSSLIRRGEKMGLVKKYNKWQEVPAKIQRLYKEDRWRVMIPSTVLFKVESIDWTQVDWVNYIFMKGYFIDNKNKRIIS